MSGLKTDIMLRRPAIGLLTAILLASSMWLYVQHILIPYQQLDARVKDRPRGNLSDLYPRWLGARELLLHHRDPYSPEVTREIQVGYYGRTLDPSSPTDPKDQQAFAYPVFVAFLLRPIVSQPFEVVRPAFTWLLVFLTAASVTLWLYVVNWRLSVVVQLTIMTLTLGSFQVAQGLKLQQLSLVVGALLAVASALVTAGHLLTGGAFLALALIKPQLTIPLLAWLLVWTFGDFKKRWRFLAGFGITGALLIAGSQIILPGWIGKFHDAVIAYRQYTGGGQSLPEVLLGTLAGRLMDGALIVSCAVFGWRARKASEGSREFALVTAFVLAVTVVIVPMVALYNQVLVLPALLILVQLREKFQRASRFTRPIEQLTLLWGVWPWLASIVLCLAALLLPTTTLLKVWFLPLYTTPSFPVFLTAILLLRLLAHPREPQPL